MSEVITFLESLGRASMSGVDPVHPPASFAVDIRTALSDRDGIRLARLLGGRPFMACSIAAPDYDEPLQDDQPATPDEEPGEPQVLAA